MIKPTPTSLPPGTQLFTVPESYSLWGSTDYAIQAWNMQPIASRTILQVIIVIALVIVGAFILTRFLKKMTERDSTR